MRHVGGKDTTITAMASLTIVGFASGSPLSQMAMARIARDHRLAAIVGPPPRRRHVAEAAPRLAARKIRWRALAFP